MQCDYGILVGRVKKLQMTHFLQSDSLYPVREIIKYIILPLAFLPLLPTLFSPRQPSCLYIHLTTETFFNKLKTICDPLSLTHRQDQFHPRSVYNSKLSFVVHSHCIISHPLLKSKSSLKLN